MNSNIIILVENFGVGLLLIIIVAIVHSKKRKKNQNEFLKYWPLIERSISEDIFFDVCYYTEAMLWNPNLRKSDFELIIEYLELHQTKYVDQIELLKSIEKLYEYRGWNAVVK